MTICPSGHEGPHCPCDFCQGLKAVLAAIRQVVKREAKMARGGK